MRDVATTEAAPDLTPPFPLPYPSGRGRRAFALLGLGWLAAYAVMQIVGIIESTSPAQRWISAGVLAAWGLVFWTFFRSARLQLQEDHIVLSEGFLRRPRKVPYRAIRRVDLTWRAESFPDLRLTLHGEPEEEVRVALRGHFTDREEKLAAWLQAKAATSVFE